MLLLVVALGRGDIVLAGDDAWLVIKPDGQVEDASEAALALLGFSLEQLRALPAGALSVSSTEREMLRAEFERTHPDAAFGRSNIRRADGSELSVAFVLRRRHDDRWEAILQPVQSSVDTPKITVSVGNVLSAWRAAERRLEELAPGTADWHAAQADIEMLRAEHRVLFERRAGGDAG